jgi:hypothetical protein
MGKILGRWVLLRKSAGMKIKSITVKKLLCCKCIIINTLLILFCRVEQSYQISLRRLYTNILQDNLVPRLCSCRKCGNFRDHYSTWWVERHTARGPVCSWFANLSFSKGSILIVGIWYADPHGSKVSFGVDLSVKARLICVAGKVLLTWNYRLLAG